MYVKPLNLISLKGQLRIFEQGIVTAVLIYDSDFSVSGVSI